MSTNLEPLAELLSSDRALRFWITEAPRTYTATLMRAVSNQFPANPYLTAWLTSKPALARHAAYMHTIRDARLANLRILLRLGLLPARADKLTHWRDCPPAGFRLALGSWTCLQPRICPFCHARAVADIWRELQTRFFFKRTRPNKRTLFHKAAKVSFSVSRHVITTDADTVRDLTGCSQLFSIADWLYQRSRQTVRQARWLGEDIGGYWCMRYAITGSAPDLSYHAINSLVTIHENEPRGSSWLIPNVEKLYLPSRLHLLAAMCRAFPFPVEILRSYEPEIAAEFALAAGPPRKRLSASFGCLRQTREDQTNGDLCDDLDEIEAETRPNPMRPRRRPGRPG